MTDTRQPRPLFEPVQYRTPSGTWHAFFNDALSDSPDRLTWDLSGIIAMASYAYPCGDRTLIGQISRKPWMSSIDQSGTARLHDIPPHGTTYTDYDTIVEEFGRRTQNEIAQACRGRKHVCFTLTGGMDSRIAAGLAARAKQAGQLEAEFQAVTWGMQDSRDAVYAKAIADALEIPWQRIDYTSENLWRNTHIAAEKLGAMVSSINLHRFDWFENLESDRLVINATYGDGIGRAEFSGRHLLELDFLTPCDNYALLKPRIRAHAGNLLQADFQALRSRAPHKPAYAQCEHEMYGHYLRGWLHQMMNLISYGCDFYQVFTSPSVYGYSWSLHPSLRTDTIYIKLLEKLNTRLARLPWARTNRAISGKTEGAIEGLRPAYHENNAWLSGPLFDRTIEAIDLTWYRDSDIFDVDSIQRLCDQIQQKSNNPDAYVKFAWLASLRQFARHLEAMGKQISLADEDAAAARNAQIVVQKADTTSEFRWGVRNSVIYKVLKPLRIKLRRHRLRQQALKDFPPTPPEETSSPEDRT